jgi:hypothetical protein
MHNRTRIEVRDAGIRRRHRLGNPTADLTASRSRPYVPLDPIGHCFISQGKTGLIGLLQGSFALFSLQVDVNLFCSWIEQPRHSGEMIRSVENSTGRFRMSFFGLSSTSRSLVEATANESVSRLESPSCVTSEVRTHRLCSQLESSRDQLEEAETFLWRCSETVRCFSPRWFKSLCIPSRSDYC